MRDIVCIGVKGKMDVRDEDNYGTRHPNNVFVCGRCGELSESGSRRVPGPCSSCGDELTVSGPARQSRCKCAACGTEIAHPNQQLGRPRHRMFAIEYYCAACNCKPSHSGRFFKKPDAADLRRVAEAESLRAQLSDRFIPPGEVPTGDESDRLHRSGATCATRRCSMTGNWPDLNACVR